MSRTNDAATKVARLGMLARRKAIRDMQPVLDALCAALAEVDTPVAHWGDCAHEQHSQARCDCGAVDARVERRRAVIALARGVRR